MPRRQISSHPLIPPLGGGRYVTLTRGKFAIVDEIDFERVSMYSWRFEGVYAISTIGGKVVRMHSFILGDQEGKEVDHKSRNALDNRRSNLRFAEEWQNKCNRSKPKNNTSGFKGVYWDKGIKRWCSSIMANKKKYFLGTFDTPESAHAAYKEAAIRLHGEFACVS